MQEIYHEGWIKQLFINELQHEKIKIPSIVPDNHTNKSNLKDRISL